MPPSLDQRQRAVAEALRAVAAEGRVPAVADRPAPVAAMPVAAAPDIRAVETRLDTLSRQIGEVLTRLDSVETAVLESVWDRPAASMASACGVEPPTAADLPGDDDADERVSVPSVPLGEVRMSSAAARALFGE